MVAWAPGLLKDTSSSLDQLAAWAPSGGLAEDLHGDPHISAHPRAQPYLIGEGVSCPRGGRAKPRGQGHAAGSHRAATTASSRFPVGFQDKFHLLREATEALDHPAPLLPAHPSSLPTRHTPAPASPSPQCLPTSSSFLPRGHLLQEAFLDPGPLRPSILLLVALPLYLMPTHAVSSLALGGVPPK